MILQPVRLHTNAGGGVCAIVFCCKCQVKLVIGSTVTPETGEAPLSDYVLFDQEGQWGDYFCVDCAKRAKRDEKKQLKLQQKGDR